VTRRALILFLSLVLAGCGGSSTATKTSPPAPTTTVRGPAPPAASPADVRFARQLLVYARDDLAAAQLAARKAASPSVHAAAQRRLRTEAREITAATGFLAQAHAAPGPTSPALRAAFDAFRSSLVMNAGFALDDAYVAGMERRDAAELALARRELRRGHAAAALRLARAAVRLRIADAAALRRV
jgi:uncharacterized protein (DUF305 family)